MRHHRAAASSRASLFTAAALLLPAVVSAVSLNCESIRIDDAKFNLGALKGPHSVSNAEDWPPNVRNTTYTVDICGQIKKDDDVDAKHQCLPGTRVCGIQTSITDDGTTTIDEVRPIARQYEHDGAQLDPKRTRLRNSPSNADSQKEGLRLELNGGKYKKVAQRAIIEFICLRDGDDKSGDGDKKEGDGDERRRSAEQERADDAPVEDGDKQAEWEALRHTDDGQGGRLSFMSWTETESAGTLRLEWNTPFACEDFAGGPSDTGSGGGGWGFFSWFFFLAFVGLLGYFGFNAWINYSRYGAQGWDLVPHADAIRDAPYVIGDWGRKVVGTLSGGGGRGGYSAV